MGVMYKAMRIEYGLFLCVYIYISNGASLNIFERINSNKTTRSEANLLLTISSFDVFAVDVVLLFSERRQSILFYICSQQHRLHCRMPTSQIT